MTSWRPPQSIRVKVIGLAWRDDCLLAVEILDAAGAVKGVRPPGGSIDFNEPREVALKREFQEELNTGIDITGPWHVFENLYVHEGVPGHEIIFAAEIRLHNESIYRRDDIVFLEDSGTPCRAVWVAMDALVSGRVALYPTGLLDVLQAGQPE